MKTALALLLSLVTAVAASASAHAPGVDGPAAPKNNPTPEPPATRLVMT